MFPLRVELLLEDEEELQDFIYTMSSAFIGEVAPLWDKVYVQLEDFRVQHENCEEYIRRHEKLVRVIRGGL